MEWQNKTVLGSIQVDKLESEGSEQKRNQQKTRSKQQREQQWYDKRQNKWDKTWNGQNVGQNRHYWRQTDLQLKEDRRQTEGSQWAGFPSEIKQHNKTGWKIEESSNIDLYKSKIDKI